MTSYVRIAIPGRSCVLARVIACSTREQEEKTQSRFLPATNNHLMRRRSLLIGSVVFDVSRNVHMNVSLQSFSFWWNTRLQFRVLLFGSSLRLDSGELLFVAHQSLWESYFEEPPFGKPPKKLSERTSLSELPKKSLSR